MTRDLDSQVNSARSALCDAGCVPVARVKAGRGVMDLVFFTLNGACLLVRCSTRKKPDADVDALSMIHHQRTFDHVVLLCSRSDQRDLPPSIISFGELSKRATDLAKLSPGWAI